MTARLASWVPQPCSCLRGGVPLAKCPRCGGSGRAEDWQELPAEVVDVVRDALDAAPAVILKAAYDARTLLFPEQKADA